MKFWIAVSLLMLSAGAAVGESGRSNYPAPPDVNIVSFIPWGQWQSTVWAPADRSAGNPLTRAEYGISGGQGYVGSAVSNARPLTERDLYEGNASVLARGGGRNYAELEPHKLIQRQPILVVENTGNRTIKSIEWEYAWIDNPPKGVGMSYLLSQASWKKARSKTTIRPGVSMHLRGENPPHPKKSQTRAFLAHGVRITRVVYTTGQEWRAP